MAPPVLGLILAGGQARRMGGGDKPLLPLGGRSLLERVAERLGPQCEAGLILSANGNPARFARFPGPVVADTVPGFTGPLAGILAGLETAAEFDRSITHVVSVPGDAPFLPRDLVLRLHAALADDTPIAHATSGGRGHYAVALWPVTLRRELRAALLREERAIHRFLAEHGAASVEWPSEPLDPFLNINTPEDLAAAEKLVI